MKTEQILNDLSKKSNGGMVTLHDALTAMQLLLRSVREELAEVDKKYQEAQ